MAAFYARRFGVTLDPETEVMPAIGAKECIFNLNLAFLDPGDVALASDPGYPVYTGGPLLAGGEPVLMPLVPELGFAPDLDAIPADALSRARLMFINYPNNPTGAIVPDGLFERVVELAAAHEILVVHDNAYSETTYDGYVAPSFLATPGAKDVGVEVFSLSKGYNMTGLALRGDRRQRRRDRAVLAPEVEHRLGLFEAVQLAGAAALAPEVDADVQGDERGLPAPARPRVRGAGAGRRRGDAAEGHDLRVGADPAGFESAAAYCEHVLEQAAVVISPGGAYGPSGEGFFRISLTTPDDRLLEADASGSAGFRRAVAVAAADDPPPHPRLKAQRTTRNEWTALVTCPLGPLPPTWLACQ